MTAQDTMLTYTMSTQYIHRPYILLPEPEMILLVLEAAATAGAPDCTLLVPCLLFTCIVTSHTAPYCGQQDELTHTLPLLTTGCFLGAIVYSRQIIYVNYSRICKKNKRTTGKISKQESQASTFHEHHRRANQCESQEMQACLYYYYAMMYTGTLVIKMTSRSVV